MKRILSAALLCFPLLPSWSYAQELGDPASYRQLACAAMGGTDITELGEMNLGKDVSVAVVCQVSLATHGAEKSAAPEKLASPQAFPFDNMTVAVHPPSGTVHVPADSAYFATSCSADLYARSSANYPDGVSNGTSEIRCRGYNSPTGSSVGCNVDWTGPTSIQLGVEPYGGSVVVNFSCFRGRSVISTVMDYSYADGRTYRISRQNVHSRIDAIYQ